MRGRRKREAPSVISFYYGLRRRLGFEAISSERLRQQILLTPEQDCEEEIRKEDLGKLRKGGLCLLAVGLLMAAVQVKNDRSLLTSVTRPGYGDVEQRVVLELSVDEEEYRIPVNVESVRYSEEELTDAFDRAWEAVSAGALGRNPDWEHVSSDLDFREETGVPGITVFWISSDVDRISAEGVVTECPEGETAEALLTAVLRYEEQELRHEVAVTVTAAELTAGQWMEQQLTQLVRTAFSDREQTVVGLPEEYEGRSLKYRSEDAETPLWLVGLLGILVEMGLWLLPEQQRRDALKERERELALAYSELVWKLTVLLGAGLTVKSAWERILRGYRVKKQEDGRKQIVYEEMQMAWNAMNQGIYEEKAYAEFGRRCGLQSYLRLGSLLESNVKQGRKGLVLQMQKEADAAFQERLQLARRQGEEASSKLLMPMMVLFALVLLILLIPAMASLQ